MFISYSWTVTPTSRANSEHTEVDGNAIIRISPNEYRDQQTPYFCHSSSHAIESRQVKVF